MDKLKKIFLIVTTFIIVFSIFALMFFGTKNSDIIKHGKAASSDKYATTPEIEKNEINTFNVRNEEAYKYFDIDYDESYNIVKDFAYSVGDDMPEGYYLVSCPVSANAVVIGSAEDQYNHKYDISHDGIGDGLACDGDIIELKNGENVMCIDGNCQFIRSVVKSDVDVKQFYKMVDVKNGT